jgi:hypothetical protein
MSTKLIALTLVVSMLGLGGVADARSSAGRHGGSHHVARSASHVRHAGHVRRRAHRTHRVYAARPHRGNHYAYGAHRGLRHGRRLNHGYVYNRVIWPNVGYNRYVNRSRLIPNTSTTTLRGNNTITVPATVTLPRSAV